MDYRGYSSFASSASLGVSSVERLLYLPLPGIISLVSIDHHCILPLQNKSSPLFYTRDANHKLKHSKKSTILGL